MLRDPARFGTDSPWPDDLLRSRMPRIKPRITVGAAIDLLASLVTCPVFWLLVGMEDGHVLGRRLLFRVLLVMFGLALEWKCFSGCCGMVDVLVESSALLILTGTTGAVTSMAATASILATNKAHWRATRDKY